MIRRMREATMTDLAKCAGKDCPQRDDCRRYVEAPAIPARFGSWDSDLARNGGQCDGFFPIKELK